MKLKQIKALEWTLQDFLKERGEFYWVTLTFGFEIEEKEAKAILHRFLSLCRKWGRSGIWIREYQRSGRIHYHVVSGSNLPVEFWQWGFYFQKKVINKNFNDNQKLVEYLKKEVLKSKQVKTTKKYSKRWGVFGGIQRSKVKEIKTEYIPDQNF
jgi:hypothetical protein